MQQVTCMFLCAMGVFRRLLKYIIIIINSIVILLFKKGKNGVRYLTYGLVSTPCKSHQLGKLQLSFCHTG